VNEDGMDDFISKKANYFSANTFNFLFICTSVRRRGKLARRMDGGACLVKNASRHLSTTSLKQSKFRHGLEIKLSLKIRTVVY